MVMVHVDYYYFLAFLALTCIKSKQNQRCSADTPDDDDEMLERVLRDTFELKSALLILDSKDLSEGIELANWLYDYRQYDQVRIVDIDKTSPWGSIKSFFNRLERSRRKGFLWFGVYPEEEPFLSIEELVNSVDHSSDLIVVGDCHPLQGRFYPIPNRLILPTHGGNDTPDNVGVSLVGKSLLDVFTDTGHRILTNNQMRNRFPSHILTHAFVNHVVV